MNVYVNPLYAESLSEFGALHTLPLSGGVVLERDIAGSQARDAMGCYPFFTCDNWGGLPSDLNDIEGDLVSLGLVLDPHGDYDISMLKHCFDHVVAFKEHHVVDLSLPFEQIGSAGRRKKARRALRQVTVEVCDNPSGFIEEWCSLYDVLVARHGIEGIRAFSRKAFQLQFSLPGVEILTAKYGSELVGALVLFWHDDVVCGHLCAVSELGYELRATYALDWFSFEYFRDRARLIDLGGGMAFGSGLNGLGAYKLGWATGSIPVYFCGRILNHKMYEEISAARCVGDTRFFPAYRKGEYS